MLMPSDNKEDKVYAFIPLLHLTNQGKLDMEQYQPFGEIEIMLNQKKEVEKVLSEETPSPEV
jgi:chromatin segregation and condensation protein Rec8/ScpA/Scc1 (kleisin family)